MKICLFKLSLTTDNSAEVKDLFVNQLKKDFSGLKNINLDILTKSSSNSINT